MNLAFVFPGQGSQSVGMLTVYADHPVVEQTLVEASEALGQDLVALVRDGPEDALASTVNTQPVMLACDVAVYRAWRAEGGPDANVLAGHSLGEYAALVVAGVFEFADALRIVRLRARAMQEAVPEGQGGIAAILGLDMDGVRASCVEASDGDVVEPANFNAPGQVVIAGARAAVERAIAAAKARGAKRAVMLPMSVPAHCALMRPAAEALARHLDAVSMHSPAIPVVNNADVAAPADPARIREALVRQLYSPVRWIEVVGELRVRGTTHILECGPGKVLQGLVKRIAPDIPSWTLASSQAIVEARSALV
ncbi:MAG: ACP S-malonyltransferase [Betaproteobacteria bacterium]